MTYAVRDEGTWGCENRSGLYIVTQRRVGKFTWRMHTVIFVACKSSVLLKDDDTLRLLRLLQMIFDLLVVELVRKRDVELCTAAHARAAGLAAVIEKSCHIEKRCVDFLGMADRNGA